MCKKPLIILINGKASSGKTKLAEIIKETYNLMNVSILHNADYVKELARNIFGWHDIKDDRGRKLLIDLANTAYNYDEYFWEKHTEEKFVPLYDDIVCIPDFRYINTYNYFVNQGYKVITIHIEMDKDINSINSSIKKDKTEQKLDVKFDYEIVNEFGNIDKLKSFVIDTLIF